MSEKTTRNEDGKLILTEDGEDIILGNSIEPIEIQTNIDTSVVNVFLEFKVGNRTVIKRLTRDMINKLGIRSLTQFGADSWEENVEAYVIDIRKNLVNAKESYEYSTVGFGSYRDKRIFKLHKGINIDASYDGCRFNLKPTGSYEKWITMANREVLGNKYLEFVLVAGFTAPVINLIAEENDVDSIIFNLCGASSIGKTASTKLALSAWGLPSTSNKGLLRTFFGTDQGILSNLPGNFGIPIGIDDTSLQQEDDKDYTQFIYQVVNGQTKSALNVDGSNRDVGEWQTTIITSSEESILESTDPNKKGVSVRIFELKAKQITSSAANAENIEKVVAKNYGHAGIIFAEHLMTKNSKQLTRRLEEIRRELLAGMDKDALSERIAKKLAVVQLTGELVREALGLEIGLEMLQETLIEMENSSVEDRNTPERAYDSLIEYFQTNMARFFKDGSKPKSSGQSLGKYRVSSDGIVNEIIIPQEKFKELMDKLGYNLDLVTDDWKKDGYLNHDRGKNTITRVFQPKTPRIAMYSINVKADSNVISLTRTDEVTEDIM